jgi:hypothetical protein
MIGSGNYKCPLRSMSALAAAIFGTVALALSTASSADSYGGGNLIRPTVTVTVQASGNGPLHYRWRSSDGQIYDTDAPSTSWRLPSGPGLHFAYVLVSDRKGGYTEARVAVSTDDVGGTPESQAVSPRSINAPAGAAPNGTDAFRSYFRLEVAGSGDIPMPGVQVFATDDVTGARYPAAGTVTTGADGSYTLPNVAYGASFTLNCSFNGGATFVSACSNDLMLPATAYSDYFGTYFFANSSIAGSVTLADGSPCGVDNDLFGVHRAATATVLDASRNVIATATVNQYGSWAAPLDPAGPTPAKVRYRCENVSTTYTLGSPASETLLPPVSFPGTGQPSITGMTAPLNGRQGLFLAEPARVAPPLPVGGIPGTPADWTAAASPGKALFPSDFQPTPNSFLAFKGHDSRMGNCQYYKSIGAVKGCNSDGSFYGAVSYEDWLRTVKMGKYVAAGGVTAHSTYINKTDLNLTREHASVRYGTDLGTVVCNHLGPADQGAGTAQFVNPGPGTSFPGATTADDAVANTIAGKNLVACVAMDYAVQPGVNGGNKFVRFYIFGPSGQLLPSINLDGRGEKFVPGSCVPCHGGDHYAGHFPEDGSGRADFGGRMLPYDAGNFTFSDADGLAPSQRDDAIYGLNQNLLAADAAHVGTPGALSLAGQSLILGWYSNPTLPPHKLDENYLPPSWQAEAAAEVAAASNGNPNGYYKPGVDAATPFYTKVVARTCRTCHVNQIDPYNFDNQANATNNFPGVVLPSGNVVYVMEDSMFEMRRNICGKSLYPWRRLQMPNSQVTYNRFWLSQDASNPANPTDMPRLFNEYINQYEGVDLAFLDLCSGDPSHPTPYPSLTPINYLP